MRPLQIPPGQWRSFFQRFARDHRGRPATLRTLDPTLRGEVEMPASRLTSIAAELEPTSKILVGFDGSRPRAFAVDSPVCVWADPSSGGRDALEIEDAAGGRTRLEVDRPEVASDMRAV